MLLKHHVKGLWFLWPLWQRTSARKHADSANAAGFTRNDWLELSEVLPWTGCIHLKLACEGIALSNFGKDQTVYFKRRGRLLRRGAWNFKSGNFACDKILYSDDDSDTFAVS